ncbi:MAG: formylglycine-generating enzyme family protein [Vicinamibacterales bacterium]
MSAVCSRLRRVRISLAIACCSATILIAQDTKFPPLGEGVPGPEFCGEAGYLPLGGQLPGPNDARETDAWLADLRHWRAERLIRAGYTADAYERADLTWTQTTFVEHFVMVHDRALYDTANARYTVERLLDELEARQGRVDAVLLWHSYPNLGLDDRNQYDLVRDLPGGLSQVRDVVERFHRRGVRVLFPLNLWDQGTRPEGVADAEAVARLMASIGADGLNGDTLAGFPPIFARAADAAGRPLALEPTDSPPAQALPWNVMSWGICWKYSFTPLVSTFKWLEPRHMVHLAPRWGRDKTNDLQFAFFNGIGIVTWENIWGIWNELTARDRETLRRVYTVARAFPRHLVSPEWTPFAPTVQTGVFSSRFPTPDSTLWTLVNRNDAAVEGTQLVVAHRDGVRYYDVWRGVEITPVLSAGRAALTFALEPHGFGAVLATAAPLPANVEAAMAEMHRRAASDLERYPTDWRPSAQTLVDTAPVAAHPSAKPATAGMIRIPGASFDFAVSGIEIEGGDAAGVDVQYPWESSPRRHHRHTIDVPSFYIDRHPVTNAEFKRFLDAADYAPADSHNFLRHWRDGSYPAGAGEQPVTWVSLDDARAYATWAGKRLPHEWEWQYAAQGQDGRPYPWGSTWDAARVPTPDTGRTMRQPDAVGTHPSSASPFGVEDLVGLVWQWTDEYADEHTRAAILRGGSFYTPSGSRWYFPQAYRLDEHGKLLLMAPSLDRSAAVGFRCVADLPR